MPDDRELTVSYEHCRRLARAAARNFYYGFALLPPAKRDALCALYAFMRHADDISDSDGGTGDKREGLNAWRMALDRALEGKYDGSRILPRSGEHTSELQSPCNLVCRLLLEKKKTHDTK